MANPEHLSELSRGGKAWNAWRRQNPGINPDLSRASLKEAGRADLRSEGNPILIAAIEEMHENFLDLSGADLSNVTWFGARLSNSRLVGANLAGADLSDADLTYAQLQQASFVCATLEGADLAEADLTGCDLTGANLMRADLDDTWIENTNFRGVDLGFAKIDRTSLAGAHGLDAVELSGPVTIGMTCLEMTARDLTLERSRRDAVLQFLRKAGLTNGFLDAFSAMIGNPIDFYSCFISYSHADKPFARRLYHRLQGDGIRCWLDEKQVLPGDDIYDRIDRGIRIWDKVLLLCSFDSLTSWWVGNEIDTALEKEQRLRKERGEKVHAIIPLNLDGTIKDWDDGRAASLRRRNWADFTNWKDDDAFEAAFERVKLALRTDEGAREEEPEGKL